MDEYSKCNNDLLVHAVESTHSHHALYLPPPPLPSLYDYLHTYVGTYVRTYIHTCTVKCTGQARGCPTCLTQHSKGTSKAPQTVGVIATLQVNWRPATKEKMQ